MNSRHTYVHTYIHTCLHGYLHSVVRILLVYLLLFLFGVGHRLLLSGHGKLDGFALSAFCWLQPSRVELCHVSGCVGRDELAHFLRAGKDCVKVGREWVG